MTTPYKDPLNHREVHFINVLYAAPVGMLLHMDKDTLVRALAKAQLACRWLEGILKLIDKLEQKGD